MTITAAAIVLCSIYEIVSSTKFLFELYLIILTFTDQPSILTHELTSILLLDYTLSSFQCNDNYTTLVGLEVYAIEK